MITSTDTIVRGTLSDEEINRYLFKLQRMIKSCAYYWCNNYTPYVDESQCVSVAMEAAWESMMKFSDRHGRTVRKFVWCAVRQRLSNHCNATLVSFRRRAGVNKPWPMNREGELKDFGAVVDEDPVDRNDNAAKARAQLQQIMELLSDRDQQWLKMRIMDGMTLPRIAEIMGITRQRVDQCVRGAITRARQQIRERKMFPELDVNGTIIQTKLPVHHRQPKGPRYKQVLRPGRDPKMSPDAFEWIDTAA